MISGAGAVIGQGIISSLRTVQCEYRLVSIDANPNSVGFQWSDAHYVVPRVDEASWGECLVDICKKEEVRLILPGIEQDVKALIKIREQLKESTKAFALLNSFHALEVGFDKWKLYQLVRQHNITVPQTWLLSDIDSQSCCEFSYPMLLKPRAGMAAKGIYRVEDKETFLFWAKRVCSQDYIIQESVGDENEEYTVSIFGYQDGSLSIPFCLKRRLNYGSTFEAETVDDAVVSQTVTKLAGLLKIIGPTNFQFRKGSDEYVLLEVNPRFSSSTSIKSAFGFNEPLMAVKSFLDRVSQVPLKFKKGRCSRYIADSITFI